MTQQTTSDQAPSDPPLLPAAVLFAGLDTELQTQAIGALAQSSVDTTLLNYCQNEYLKQIVEDPQPLLAIRNGPAASVPDEDVLRWQLAAATALHVLSNAHLICLPERSENLLEAFTAVGKTMLAGTWLGVHLRTILATYLAKPTRDPIAAHLATQITLDNGGADFQTGVYSDDEVAKHLAMRFQHLFQTDGSSVKRSIQSRINTLQDFFDEIVGRITRAASLTQAGAAEGDDAEQARRELWQRIYGTAEPEIAEVDRDIFRGNVAMANADFLIKSVYHSGVVYAGDNLEEANAAVAQTHAFMDIARSMANAGDLALVGCAELLFSEALLTKHSLQTASEWYGSGIRGAGMPEIAGAVIESWDLFEFDTGPNLAIMPSSPLWAEFESAAGDSMA